MATNTTTYDGGNVNVQTAGGGYSQTPNMPQQQQAQQHQGPSILEEYLRYKQAQQAKALQASTPNESERSKILPQQYMQGGLEGGGARQQQAQAMSDPGIPNYIKMVGQGPASTPGYIQARAGEPGAVFAGYIPRGANMGPNNAGFQPGGSVSAPAGNESPSPPTGPAPAYNGGGAVGPGADFAREQMRLALQRSNYEIAAKEAGNSTVVQAQPRTYANGGYGGG